VFGVVRQLRRRRLVATAHYATVVIFYANSCTCLNPKQTLCLI
jgi:hypothetical protein